MRPRCQRKVSMARTERYTAHFNLLYSQGPVPVIRNPLNATRVGLLVIGYGSFDACAVPALPSPYAHAAADLRSAPPTQANSNKNQSQD